MSVIKIELKACAVWEWLNFVITHVVWEWLNWWCHMCLCHCLNWWHHTSKVGVPRLITEHVENKLWKQSISHLSWIVFLAIRQWWSGTFSLFLTRRVSALWEILLQACNTFFWYITLFEWCTGNRPLPQSLPKIKITRVTYMKQKHAFCLLIYIYILVFFLHIRIHARTHTPGVGLMVRVVSLGL